MTKIGSDVRAAKDLTTALLRYLAMMAFPLLLGLAALSRPLVQVVYGSAFRPAAKILAILAVFSIVRAALTLVLLLFSAFDIQGLAVKVMTACAALNLLLDLLLIPKHGALGAAVASAIAQCAGISMLWFVLASKMQLRLGWRRLLPIAAAAIGTVIPAAVLAVVWPPWPALLGGTLAGVVLYAPLMRIAGVLKKSDQEHFATLVPLIPVRLQFAATRLMSWLTQDAG
jgi:O-antigen/teichoic acid export membrane protein